MPRTGVDRLVVVHRPGGRRLDHPELYGWSANRAPSLVRADHTPLETLPDAHRAHPCLDALDVLGSEGPLDVEVVVEPFSIGGPIADLVPGHRSVTACAMTWAVGPQDGQALLRRDGNRFDPVAVVVASSRSRSPSSWFGPDRHRVRHPAAARTCRRRRTLRSHMRSAVDGEADDGVLRASDTSKQCR